ncbi:hypothetical protein VE25_02895 [Devosia geojensis]|uniref:Uncharacterized protein n=1 Tax=Devosia geojensis TaxID=443610 RepID=A0A0F5FWI5_9HYPH|nr:hypothetical protein [Devosia geojensis]KKB13246.1 hypothetical protein VE25_02895 [Devosia geojensis]
MIPASYLFKDVYRREWLDPEVEADRVAASHRSGRGRTMLSRLGVFMRHLFAPADRPQHDWTRTPAE